MIRFKANAPAEKPAAASDAKPSKAAGKAKAGASKQKEDLLDLEGNDGAMRGTSQVPVLLPVALDQIANQVAKYRYMSRGQCVVPPMIRAAQGGCGECSW